MLPRGCLGTLRFTSNAFIPGRPHLVVAHQTSPRTAIRVRWLARGLHRWLFASHPASVRLRITCHSTGPSTAGQLGPASAVALSCAGRAKLPCRSGPVSSNVRQHTQLPWSIPRRWRPQSAATRFLSSGFINAGPAGAGQSCRARPKAARPHCALLPRPGHRGAIEPARPRLFGSLLVGPHSETHALPVRCTRRDSLCETLLSGSSRSGGVPPLLLLRPRRGGAAAGPQGVRRLASVSGQEASGRCSAA
jgi:hypothetical protein